MIKYAVDLTTYDAINANENKNTLSFTDGTYGFTVRAENMLEAINKTKLRATECNLINCGWIAKITRLKANGTLDTGGSNLAEICSKERQIVIDL